MHQLVYLLDTGFELINVIRCANDEKLHSTNSYIVATWCSPGMSPEIHLLVVTWRERRREQYGCSSCNNTQDVPPVERSDVSFIQTWFQKEWCIHWVGLRSLPSRGQVIGTTFCNDYSELLQRPCCSDCVVSASVILMTHHTIINCLKLQLCTTSFNSSHYLSIATRSHLRRNNYSWLPACPPPCASALADAFGCHRALAVQGPASPRYCGNIWTFHISA